MEYIGLLISFILHIDQHLQTLCANYGLWVYAILFVIVFCETGFVVTPFLPGDSLLFAVGSLAAIGALDLTVVMVLLAVAAITGDTVNYWAGNYVGPKVFHEEHSRFLNKEYLHRTHAFYERHGGKTIIIALFLPIIRTFAPFVAGIGSMTYSRFLVFNVVGGVLWVTLFVELFPGFVSPLEGRRSRATRSGKWTNRSWCASLQVLRKSDVVISKHLYSPAGMSILDSPPERGKENYHDSTARCCNHFA